MSVAEASAGPLAITSQAYFERLAAAEYVHWWPEGMWRLASHWLDAALRGRSRLRAADVGCGSAGATVRLAGRPEVADVIALDASPLAIELARHRTDRLVRADALRLPFADASIDLATSFDVWQHLPEGDDNRAAAELFRVLRPGGVALVRANGRGLWPDRRSGSRLFRLGDLAGPLRSAGFIVRRATHANFLPSVAQELVGRLRPARSASAGHPAGGGLCLRVPPPWLNRLMGGVAGAEALAAGRLGVRLPAGHSTMALAIKA